MSRKRDAKRNFCNPLTLLRFNSGEVLRGVKKKLYGQR